MKKILTVLSLSISMSGMAQQSSWMWTNPLPAGNGLRDVAFSSSSTAWAVGEWGALLFTSDAGIHWQQHPSYSQADFNSVHFTDSLHGWIVGGWPLGDSGIVLATTNAGLTWKQKDVGDPRQLRDVFFLDENNGWVSGNRNILLHTTDAGATWNEVYLAGANFTIHGIFFLNDSIGCAVGTGGTIRTTTDGGKEWTVQNSTVTNVLYDGEFTDALHGFAVGSGGVILSTSDGGVTWEQLFTGLTGTLNDITMVNAKDGMIVGDKGTVFETDDSGRTWSQVSSFGADDELFSVAFNGSSSGICVGSTGDGTAVAPILQTITAGIWDSRIINKAPGKGKELRNVFFVDNVYGWSCGGSIADATTGATASSVMLRTTDGGATWEPQTVSTTSVLVSVHFTSPTKGWTCGKAGALFKTVDGGATWTSVTVAGINQGVSYDVTRVQFLTDNIGWVAPRVSGSPPLGGNKIFKTTNGGDTWIEQVLPQQHQPLPVILADIGSFFMLNQLLGWTASTGTGEIYKTTNGGTVWLYAGKISKEKSLNDIYFVDETTGWVVGPEGIIEKTMDGGATWTPQEVEPGTVVQQLYGVRFINLNVGWIVGSTYKAILCTTDGGTTWRPQLMTVPGSGHTLYSVFPFNEEKIIIVGGNVFTSLATILTTTTGGDEIPAPKVSELRAEPGMIDFGVRAVASENDTTFEVKNVGNEVLNVSSSAFTNGSQYSIVSGGAPFALTPDSVRTITVKYAPTASGIHSDTLMLTSDAVTPSRKIFFIGRDSVVKIGEVQLSADFIDYGVRENMSANDTTFTIKNVGNDILNVTSVAFSTGAFYSIFSGGAPFTLAPDASHPLTIRYQPTSEGLHRDSLIVTSDGSVPVVMLIVLGRDSTIKIGNVEVSAAIIEYGKRNVGSQNDTSFTIKNVGNGILNVTQTNFVDGTNFSIVSGGAFFSLMPGAAQSVVVRFTPTLLKNYVDTLVITSDGAMPTKKIIFSGEADSVPNSSVRDEDRTKNSFSVAAYPNPFSGATTFHIEEVREDSKGVVKIFDMFGQEISAGSFHGNSFILDANGFATGIYLCRIQIDDAFVSHAITVIR